MIAYFKFLNSNPDSLSLQVLPKAELRPRMSGPVPGPPPEPGLLLRKGLGFWV